MQLAQQQALRDVSLSIDEVFRSSDPLNLLQQAWEKGEASAEESTHLLAPVGSQEADSYTHLTLPTIYSV